MPRVIDTQSSGTCTANQVCLGDPERYRQLFTYDGRNRLASYEQHGCSGAGNVDRVTRYIYDDVNSSGRLSQIIGPRVENEVKLEYEPCPSPSGGPCNWLKFVRRRTGSADFLVREYRRRDGEGNPTCIVDENGVFVSQTWLPGGRLATSTRRVQTDCDAMSGEDLKTTYGYDDHVGHVSSILRPAQFGTGSAWLYKEDDARGTLHRNRWPMTSLSRTAC